jgi:hypothetical protein
VRNAEGLTRLSRRLDWASVWTGVTIRNQVPVVSDLQLILDLWNHPIRGIEQAELILEKHLLGLRKE